MYPCEIVVVVVGLALLAREVHAQAPSPLTPAEVYRRIEPASPRLAAARARSDAARARIGPASRWPDPALQLALMNRSLPRLGLSDPLAIPTNEDTHKNVLLTRHHCSILDSKA